VNRQIQNIYKFLLLIVTFFSITTLLHAQVMVEGKINTRGKNILVSVYSKDSHHLIPVNDNGTFECRLPRYEECVIVAYEKSNGPKTFSFNTEKSCSESIKLNITLDDPRPKDQDLLMVGPKARYITNGSSFSKETFNLDNVKDKSTYAIMMSSISKDLDGFYKNNIIPTRRIGYGSKVEESSIIKTEHKLGEEIYQLLVRKRALQSQLDVLNSNYSSGTVSSYRQCDIDLTLLKKEASFEKIDFELAQKRLDKEKFNVRRRETAGKSISNDGVRNATRNMNTQRRKYEIAALNMKNKQADCWELKLQADINAEIESGSSRNDTPIKIKQLDISDVRYKQRIDNARKLMNHHNQLASDYTGRDRLVQLMNAQKYISEQEQVKLYTKENNLSRWGYKDGGTGKYNKQIQMAKEQVAFQREIAFQAEMAYLEHVWNLRGKAQVGDFVEDLFTRQNDLLAVPLIPRNEEKEKEEALDNITDEEILAVVKVNQTADERGDVKEVTFDTDVYEIIIDRKGRKTFKKNGNAITALTYKFETKRRFGEIIEKITQEERKKTLWDLFRKKVD